MYQIVQGTVGDLYPGTFIKPPKQKKWGRQGRPMIFASILGVVLVMAAIVAWCYYSASLRRAEILKTELLELKKDGFTIRNQEADVIFRMFFRFVLDFSVLLCHCGSPL